MLIKLAPPPSAAATPTILFAISFPDLPLSLPVPPAWAAQLARLTADDLEAPPVLHALDRAAALPCLLAEVLFDLPAARVACTFLDGAAEDWSMDARCADMLARVIQDVEESGRAEERAREWARAVEEERARLQMAREQAQEAEQEREKDREAEMEREYESQLRSLKAKGKGKEQSLNSPPTSVKGARPKSRLHRSRSLLMALVATFSNSPASSSLPKAPVSAPASRSSFSDTSPRAPSPLRAFARRASFSALSSMARADPPASEPSDPFADEPPASPPPPPPPAPVPHNLETPPASAPPSAPSSAFARQQGQGQSAPFSGTAFSFLERGKEMTPRALRRRARSTLVDAFRAHVLPELGGRVGLFEASSSTSSPPRAPSVQEPVESESNSALRAPGGGYHAWVARSMLRRAEARMRELEEAWPALTRRASPYASADSQSPQSPSYPPFSPDSLAFSASPTTIVFPASPTSPTHPRQATFEAWSSDESESESESDDDDDDEDDSGIEGGSDGSGETDTDGSSVHTPESGHSIVYGHGHALDVSTSTTSSYFTCSDATETEADAEKTPTQVITTTSHLRAGAQSSESPTTRRAAARKKEEARERKRAARAARAEHTAFARMTARLRLLLAQGAAQRGAGLAQKEESERLREGRGVRRGWLEGGRAALVVAGRKNTNKKAKGNSALGLGLGKAFRPSGLGRWVWDAVDAEAEEDEGEGEVVAEKPPAYEDAVAFARRHTVHRTRARAPITRSRAHTSLAHLDTLELEVELDVDVHFDAELDAAALDGLDIDVDLEHLDLSNALDAEGMGFDGDGGGDMGMGGFRDVDVFADVTGSGKGRGKGRREKGRREVWERRRMVAV
ncbi:hypothetical protein C8R44DRAFT_934449 [Mycena epipterygia]|nr:hypothetical protein C8R44DRAFT_934449 [Mycena epipterygia]